jgi:hypothetical protein
MPLFSSPLDRLHIASPCAADWNDMIGSDRVRFCGQCRKNVYHLSNMSRKEAERLIAQREGGMCVRFYRRADGTVITSDCPVGLRLIKRRVSRVAKALISTTLSFIAGVSAYAGLTSNDVDPSAIQPVSLIEKVPTDTIETAPSDTAKPLVGEYFEINGGI